MAENKNITMKQYNGTDYDVLYPKTKVSQVDGAVASVNNVTPDNTGAVKVDTFEQSIKVGKNVDVGTNGGPSAVQFHFDGNANANTSRIVESESGALTVDAILKLTQALGIEFGGTGSTDRATALGVLSGGGTYSGDFNNAFDPGVYWVDLSSCSNGPSTSGYGWLEICKLSTDSNSEIQRFTYYEDGEIVVRSYVNSQWHSWCRHDSISLPVSVANGGTGATSTAGANQNLFNSGEIANATGYPTVPGIWRTVGTNIFSNLKAPHGNYGILIIFKAVYGLHIYVDELGRFYWGRSGDSFGEPAKWYGQNTLAPDCYGTSLPSAGNAGRIFYKKV